jgi:SanA protein
MLTSKRKRRLVYAFILILSLVALPIVFVAGTNFWVYQAGKSRLYYDVDKAPKHKVALVLGARVLRGGRLSAVLEDRVYTAVSLYKNGKVEKLLMSGDNSETHYDEVTAMRRRAIELGVPADNVVRDFAGFRTWDSIYRARDVWGLHDFTIVSQEFHLTRALFLARHLGVSADGMVADRRDYVMKYGTLREFGARTLAWCDAFVRHPVPHFLGAHETLSGLEQDEKERS